MLRVYGAVRRARVPRAWLVAWAWGVLALAGVLNPRGAVVWEEAASARSVQLPPSDAVLTLIARARPNG